MPVDLRIAFAARRRLEAAVYAPTEAEVDERLDRFATLCTKSPRRLDAAFLATQTLRDLEVINADEAVFLLEKLCSLYVERASKDKPIGKIPETEEELDRHLKMSHRRDAAVIAALHRERGETALAEMMLNDPEAYGTLRAEGEISLMMDIPEPETDAPPGPDPQQVGAVSEPILAYFTTEWGKDRYVAWQKLITAIHDAGPASAIAAVQNIRGLGVISFDESLALIDLIISGDVDAACEADRESRRLSNAIDRLDAQIKQAPVDEGQPDPRVVERERLSVLSMHRYDRLQAVCLRRYGEHRMANLLTTNQAEYERIRDEAI